MINKVVRVTLVPVFVLAGAACAMSAQRVPLDPAANFAAHAEHRGIVVDRMDDGKQAMLVANSMFSARPPFVVEEGDRDVAALSFDGSTFHVRDLAANAPAGDVTASWRGGAIRFAFHPSGHDALHTGAFHREGWGGPELLGQPATTILDLAGTYRAEVRDAADRPVGWLRVEIGRYGPVLRVYDGDLPATINGPLAVAAVERLDSDIDWVEQHAMNPYIGN